MIGRTNSAGVMPVGTINITENGTYSISSFSQAIVSVSGLVPSGTLEISSNGTYDVTSYASASVNVQGGGMSEAYEWVDAIVGAMPSASGAINYTGYSPSRIRSWFAQNFYNLGTFNPTFSSNWNHIFIGRSAFYNCVYLREVSFLSTSAYKTVESYTFYYCLSLSTPVVNVTSIGNMAFSTCERIPYFDIDCTQSANKDIIIPDYCFAQCNPSYVRIKANNIYCSTNAFYWLGAVQVNPHYDMQVLLEASTISFATQTFAWTKLSSLSISNISGALGSSFAMNCSYLQTVSLTFLSDYVPVRNNAFISCYSLSSISISHLNQLSLRLTLYSLCFAYCSALKDFPYWDYVAWNGNQHFRNTGIVSIYRTVSTGEFQIPYSCFYVCKSLKYVSIPTLTTVSSYAFFACSSLSYFGAATKFYKAEAAAFQGCSNLKSIAMMNSLRRTGGILSLAFAGCSSLESVYLRWQIDLSNTNAFQGTPLSDSSYLGYYGSIYVTEHDYSLFTNATNWVAYSDRFVSITDAEMEQIITDYNNVQYVEPEENE